MIKIEDDETLLFLKICLLAEMLIKHWEVIDRKFPWKPIENEIEKDEIKDFIINKTHGYWIDYIEQARPHD